jgi:serine/threonine-protein kinase HipA
VDLLLRESDDPETDVGAFLDALALNWVIGGTDAHAKNYSLLLSPGSVRLAPLYDLISVLPYPRRVHYRQAKLAMRVDREYHLWKIRRRHWEGLAVRCDLDPEPLVGRVTELVAAVPGAVERASVAVRDEGIDHEIVERLESEIRKHSEDCLRTVERVG